MNISIVDVGQHTAFFRHLLIQGRSRDRRVELELVEVGVVGDGVFNLAKDVIRGVMLEPDDRRSLYANTVLAKFAGELACVPFSLL